MSNSKVKKKKVNGRPNLYTDELGIDICKRLACGESLKSICRDPAMPCISSVMNWLLSDSELHAGFLERYDHARRIQAQILADELMDIADDGSNDYMERNDPENGGYAVNGEALGRSRLRVDTRKWFMSKVIPKFKDKPEEDTTPKNQPITINLVKAEKDAD